MRRCVVLLLAAVLLGSFPRGAGASPGSQQLIARARKLAHATPPRLTDSFALLEKAVQADPADPDAQFFLAYVAVQCERPRRAVAALDALQRMRAMRPHAYFLKGRALAMLERHEEALAAYDLERDTAANPFFTIHRNKSLVALGRTPAPDVEIQLEQPAPRLVSAVATRFEYDGRAADPVDGEPATPLGARAVTSLDLDYALSRSATASTGVAASGVYQGAGADSTVDAWVGRLGLYGSTAVGSATAGAEVETFVAAPDSAGLEYTGATLRMRLGSSARPGHLPSLTYELTRRDVAGEPDLPAENRDGVLQALTLGYAWLPDTTPIGPLELRVSLGGAQEDTTGGFFDTVSRSALVSAVFSSPVLPWARAAVEVGASLDRTRFTDEQHALAMGAERTDDTTSVWVNVRQPLRNPRTAVELRYGHSGTRSTIEGLQLSGHVASVGMNHVF